MLRKLYDRVLALAASRHAPWALAAVSFAESSFFPIPPDVMLAPMVAARPQRAYLFAAICTAASVLGGLLGYTIGMFLTPLAHSILTFFGHANGQQEFQAWFARYGLGVILFKGLTPIPFKLVTISAGLAHFDLFTFVWAATVTRGARFFIEAAVLKTYGAAILREFEKRLSLYTLIFLALLIAGVIALKVLG
ncbi:MAG: YqaA family protein [Caulobacterales bacterium]|jgi:membrane protein YqaA with SNARE-associated domain